MQVAVTPLISSTGIEQAFFEETQSGELLSRLTTDTELVQTLLGSAVSVALRQALMLIGALVLLVLASPRLSFGIVIGIALVVAPIFWIGTVENNGFKAKKRKK